MARRAEVVAAVVLAFWLASCAGEVRRVGKLDDEGSGGNDAQGVGGAGTAPAGVGGSELAGTGGLDLSPYDAACQANCERNAQVAEVVGCGLAGACNPSGLCEHPGLLPQCKLAMVPVIECFTASLDPEDCFCEGRLECSYYPACYAFRAGAPPECGWEDFAESELACRAGDPMQEHRYCDFADDACGAGETLGQSRGTPPSCSSPWEDVCGCDGQLYDDLCDALNAGIDIDASRAACGR